MLAFQKPSDRRIQGGKEPPKFNNKAVGQMFPASNGSSTNSKNRATTFSAMNPFQKQHSQDFSRDGMVNAVKEQPSTFTSMKSNTNVQATANTDLSSLELQFDQLIGGLPLNRSAFAQLNHSSRPVPKFLLYESPVLFTRQHKADSWDKQNQEKLAQMENSTTDPSTLYETFIQMRDAERKIMEQKGLVDGEETRRSLEDAISFEGSCLQMCPIFERVRRSIENDVRKYEKNSDGKISKEKAIKAFSRPAAGQPPPLPSDVRPPSVLVETLDYIIENLLSELPEAQSFIWDRTRSIRQDFTYQNYSGPEAIECHEKIVRIHILTLHIMASSSQEYSQQQELEQMNKALKTLSDMYLDHRSRGHVSPNEAEFRAYYLLSQIRDQELDREIQSLPLPILKDERVQLALAIRNLVQVNIVERGFQFSENTFNQFKTFFLNFKTGAFPTLMSFMLEIHLNEIRFYALKTMKRAIHAKARLSYKEGYLIDLLCFNGVSDLASFCSYYGIEIAVIDGKKYVDLSSLIHNSHIIPDKKPLKQAYSNTYNQTITSFKELIDSGVSNLRVGIDTPQQIVSTSMSNLIQPTISGAPVESSNSVPQFFASSSAQKVSNSRQEALELREAKKKEKVKQENIREDEERQKNQREEASRKERELVRMEEMRQQMIKKQEAKRLRKEELLSTLSQSTLKQMVQFCVHNEVESVSQSLVKGVLLKKQFKERMLNVYSEGLFEAFINELLYFETLSVLSEKFRQVRLKRLLISQMCKAARSAKNKMELKKRKREEFIEVSKSFGLPNLIKRKRTANDCSGMSATHRELSTERLINSIKKPKPIDLSVLNFDSLLKNLKPNHYQMLIFSEELESTTSKFIKRKFGVEDCENRRLSSAGVELQIVGTDQINPKHFENANIVIFNCDGVEKIKTQKLLLQELLKGISFNTNYRFELLVIYWEFEGVINFTQNEILQELDIPKTDTLLSTRIVKLDPNLDCSQIQNCLDKMGKVVELTPRGLYNEKYKKPSKPHISRDILTGTQCSYVPANDLNPKKKDKSKIYNHFKKHIEASPAAKPLPILLSSPMVKQVKPTLEKRPVDFIGSGGGIDDLFKPKVNNKLKIEIYSTPRPKSSELLQTPSFMGNSSTISNLSNITFASNTASTPVISKPSYAQVVTNSLISDGKKEQEIPGSILELRKLAASVKERHLKK